MTKKLVNILPQDLDVKLGDDAAIQRGEQAAARVIAGTGLRDQLEVGDAILRLKKQALIDAGMPNEQVIGYGGSAVNAIFSAALAKHPKLAAVNAHDRANAMKCVEQWAFTKIVLANLNDWQRQRIRVNSLWRLVEQEMGVPPRDVREPRPRRQDPFRVLHEAVVAAGLGYRDGRLFIADTHEYASWRAKQVGDGAFLSKIEDLIAVRIEKQSEEGPL